MNLICAEINENSLRFAFNFQRRNAVRAGLNFDVVPGYFPAPAGFQSLQKRFFGGETGGERLRRRRASRFTVAALLRGENPRRKTRRSRNRLADAVNFDDVYSDGNYHGSENSRFQISNSRFN